MIAVFVVLLFYLTGCVSGPVNPSFAVTRGEAKQIIEEIEVDPRPLERPVVVMAGWADPGFADSYWKNQVGKITGEDRVIGLKFIFRGDFESCRDHVIAEVQEAWPSDDAAWTTEVDVVAFSMGGLVARYCAAPSLRDREPGVKDEFKPPKRRLRVRQLFTISTPHRGAMLAGVPTLDRRLIDMRAGSDFLAHLDAALPDARYTLIPYTRLGDPVVGTQNTAPPGVLAWWVDTPFLHRPHQEAYRDPRIRADILLRLRGQAPLTRTPAAALPKPE